MSKSTGGSSSSGGKGGSETALQLEVAEREARLFDIKNCAKQ